MRLRPKTNAVGYRSIQGTKKRAQVAAKYKQLRGSFPGASKAQVYKNARLRVAGSRSVTAFQKRGRRSGKPLTAITSAIRTNRKAATGYRVPKKRVVRF